MKKTNEKDVIYAGRPLIWTFVELVFWLAMLALVIMAAIGIFLTAV
jgi:hypothetical protein